MNSVEVEVTARLVVLLRLCRTKGVLFRPLYQEALKRFQREVREQAIEKAIAELDD